MGIFNWLGGGAEGTNEWENTDHVNEPENKTKERQVDDLTVKLAQQRISNMKSTTAEDVETLRKIAKELQP